VKVTIKQLEDIFKFYRNINSYSWKAAPLDWPLFCSLSEILTGDNFYEAGVTSAFDSKFNASWASVYPVLPGLESVPWYLIFGY
jgi:hypothetical protein